MTRQPVTVYPNINDPDNKLGGILVDEPDEELRVEFVDDSVPDYPGCSDGEAVKLMDPGKRMLERFMGGAYKVLHKYKTPYPQMAPAVQEIYDIFDRLIEIEKTDVMVKRWETMRDLMCVFLQEDIAYRLRFQWSLEQVNFEKCKLRTNDRYWLKTFTEIRTELIE